MRDDLEAVRGYLRPNLPSDHELEIDVGALVCVFAGVAVAADARAEASRFAYLHLRALIVLMETERYSCRDRAVALFEMAQELKHEALPPDFFHRLAVVWSKVRKQGNRGPRNPGRDDDIRQQYRRLRDYDVLPRERAIEAISEKVGLSPESVERIIGQVPVFNKLRDLRIEDLVRIGQYVGDSYPSKPMDLPLGANRTAALRALSQVVSSSGLIGKILGVAADDPPIAAPQKPRRSLR